MAGSSKVMIILASSLLLVLAVEAHHVFLSETEHGTLEGVRFNDGASDGLASMTLWFDASGYATGMQVTRKFGEKALQGPIYGSKGLHAQTHTFDKEAFVQMSGCYARNDLKMLGSPVGLSELKFTSSSRAVFKFGECNAQDEKFDSFTVPNIVGFRGFTKMVENQERLTALGFVYLKQQSSFLLSKDMYGDATPYGDEFFAGAADGIQEIKVWKNQDGFITAMQTTRLFNDAPVTSFHGSATTGQPQVTKIAPQERLVAIQGCYLPRMLRTIGSKSGITKLVFLIASEGSSARSSDNSVVDCKAGEEKFSSTEMKGNIVGFRGKFSQDPETKDHLTAFGFVYEPME